MGYFGLGEIVEKRKGEGEGGKEGVREIRREIK
jgi:hypothetical protein